MRGEGEALRHCPTCGGPVRLGLGLRDYQWINEYLPGFEGATDGDLFIEKSGEVLMLEAKPWSRKLTIGQRIFLKAMVRKGIHVWVVFESEDRDAKGRPERVRAGAMDRRGATPFMEDMSLRELKDQVLAWRAAAEAGTL